MLYHVHYNMFIITDLSVKSTMTVMHPQILKFMTPGGFYVYTNVYIDTHLVNGIFYS